MFLSLIALIITFTGVGLRSITLGLGDRLTGLGADDRNCYF